VTGERRKVRADGRSEPASQPAERRGDEAPAAAAAAPPDRPAQRGRLGARDAPGFAQPLPPAERIKVHVVLERHQLEDLELLVRHRHGAHSRSAVIRLAVRWYLAKEAEWLIRERGAEQHRREREAELERARTTPREERDRLDGQARIRTAVEIAGGGDLVGDGGSRVGRSRHGGPAE